MVDTPDPPTLTPDCGQHQCHCLDHLLLLTDTNPSVISQVQQGSLPASPRVGSQACELSLHSCPQSAQSQLCSVSLTARGCTSQPPPSIPPPSADWNDNSPCVSTTRVFCLSSASIYVLFGYSFVFFFFFLPQCLQSLQLLERCRWAGWYPCLRARQ